MSLVVQLLAGLLFGAGLAVSGMADPAKVTNFLDIAGQFDPSLAFVMGGAVVVAFIGFRLVLTRPHPVFAPNFNLPTSRAIDARLLVGAGLFGIGWGLAGFCPGPALASLGLGATGTFIFVPAMLAGMVAARLLAQGGAPVLAR